MWNRQETCYRLNFGTPTPRKKKLNLKVEQKYVHTSMFYFELKLCNYCTNI